MKESGDMLRKHCRVFYGVDSTRCAVTKTSEAPLQPKPMSQNELIFSESLLAGFNQGASRRFLKYHPCAEIQRVYVATSAPNGGRKMGLIEGFKPSYLQLRVELHPMPLN